MTLSLVAVVILLLGLLLHYIGGGKMKGATTLGELGRAMIWASVFYLTWQLAGHGQLALR